MKKITITLSFLFFITIVNAQTATDPTRGCVEGDCFNGAGKFLFANGDKFNGYWTNGIRNDYGRYDWKNGDWYLGDFKNDSISGSGSFHFAGGEVVNGKWQGYKLIGVDNGTEAKHIGLTLQPMQKKDEALTPEAPQPK